jgi:hypothetical protein
VQSPHQGCHARNSQGSSAKEQDRPFQHCSRLIFRDLREEVPGKPVCGAKKQAAHPMLVESGGEE